MTGVSPDRTLPWDWYPGKIPVNVNVAESAFVETSFSFLLFRSERANAVSIGQGASTYLGTMFDVGPNGCVTVGDFTLVHGARIICDADIRIDEYALVSWNVVLMDSYRAPFDPDARREMIRRMAERSPRVFDAPVVAKPVHVGRAAWIGFDSCILPGVTVGEGAVVGARSVVTEDVQPFTIVAGNPARLVRRLTDEEIARGR
jgi:acetyltransferase-like isoleucine patch superfamily enzyme